MNINVHLNGGKTEADKEIRTAQLTNLVEVLNGDERLSKIQTRVISGDFNTDISEVKENLEKNL